MASPAPIKAGDAVTRPETKGEMDNVGSVTITSRISEFWCDQPRLWFVQAEAVLAPQKVGDEVKYNIIVTKLGKDVIQQVSDILLTPPQTGKYEALKTRLLTIYEESESRQFQKLLSEMELGDQKPSQLLRRMRDLARNKIPDETLRMLWSQHLPAATRAVLAVIDAKDLENLATVADKISETARPAEVAAVAREKSRSRDYGVELAKLTAQVAQLQTRNRVERTASKRWRGSVRRLVSAAIYNLSCFTHGCSTGWVSGVLGSEALAGGAWLAALPCLVALPAAPFFAVLANARGRKAGAFCISISFILSWSLAAFCGPRGIWAARVAAGAGGAGALSLAPLYCAEIAPRTRCLVAMPALASSCGILFAYTAGPLMSAHSLALAMSAPPLLLLASLLWLPETPSYLISIGRMQDAARVMCWFNGSDFREDLTDVIEQQEVRIRTNDCYGTPHRMDGLRRQDSDAFQPMLKRSSGMDSDSVKKGDKSAFKELFRHRRSRRALASCLALVAVAAGSGAGAVSSFAAGVLRRSADVASTSGRLVLNSTVRNGTTSRTFFETPEAGSMVCGAALVLGAVVAAFSVDKLGRKMLLIWSCSGIACCLAVLGAYCDPRLNMHSWLHTHRIWSYTTYQTPFKPSEEVVRNMTHLNLNLTNKADPAKPIAYRIGQENSEGLKLNENGRKDLGGLVQNSTELRRADRDTIWPPVLLLSMVLFFYNVGLGSVPIVLVSELFTMTARSLATSLVTSSMWLTSFLVLRYFASLTVSLGFHGTYYLGASVTLIGSVYTFAVVPETKGKTREQIDDALEGPWVLSFRRPSKNDENT